MDYEKNYHSINKYLIRNDYILKLENKGKKNEHLVCKKKNIFTFIASRILQLDSYKLSTVCHFIKGHQKEFDQYKDVADSFYKKLNRKIFHHNSRHPKDPINHIKKLSLAIKPPQQQQPVSEKTTVVVQIKEQEKEPEEKPSTQVEKTQLVPEEKK